MMITRTPPVPTFPKAKHDIVFVNEVAGTTEQKSAADVPPQVAFVNGVPVTKVLIRARGDAREILSYGADGKLLATNLMIKT